MPKLRGKSAYSLHSDAPPKWFVWSEKESQKSLNESAPSSSCVQLTAGKKPQFFVDFQIVACLLPSILDSKLILNCSLEPRFVGRKLQFVKAPYLNVMMINCD